MKQTALTILEDQILKFNKDLIGFDKMFNRVLLNAPLNTSNYPPYNLQKLSDDNYRVTIAVAGFSKENLDVSVENGMLTVTGSKPSDGDDKYIFKGIADRDFTLRYAVVDYVEVKSATVENGLLILELVRELPEAMKPKKIEIK